MSASAAIDARSSTFDRPVSRSKTPTVRSYSRSSLLDDVVEKKKVETPRTIDRTVKSTKGRTGLVNLGNTVSKFFS
jgi:hypothetical protein